MIGVVTSGSALHGGVVYVLALLALTVTVVPASTQKPVSSFNPLEEFRISGSRSSRSRDLSVAPTSVLRREQFRKVSQEFDSHVRRRIDKLVHSDRAEAKPQTFQPPAPGGPRAPAAPAVEQFWPRLPAPKLRHVPAHHGGADRLRMKASSPQAAAMFHGALMNSDFLFTAPAAEGNESAGKKEEPERKQKPVGTTKNHLVASNATAVREELCEVREKRGNLTKWLGDYGNATVLRQTLDARIDDVSKKTNRTALVHMVGRMWKFMREYSVPLYEERAREDLVVLDLREKKLEAQSAALEPEVAAPANKTNETVILLELRPPLTRSALDRASDEFLGKSSLDSAGMWALLRAAKTDPILSDAPTPIDRFGDHTPTKGGKESDERELHKVERRRKALKMRLENLEDRIAFVRSVNKRVEDMSSETESPAMARVFGQMWMELRDYSLPSYKEFLEKEITRLRDREAELRRRLLMRKVNEEESQTPPQDQPMYTAKTMPSVSPALWCILFLSWMFFVLYIWIAVVSTWEKFSDSPRATVWRRMANVTCWTVWYAPMLCILFLWTRLSTQQGDHAEKEVWRPCLKCAMYLSTGAVFGQLLLVICVVLLTRSDILAKESDDSDIINTDCTLKYEHLFGITDAAMRRITLVRDSLLFVVFFSVATILITMHGFALDNFWHLPDPLVCISILVQVFYAVFLGTALSRMATQSLDELPSRFMLKVKQVFNFARYTVNLVPMLCILFMVARFRSMQVDSDIAEPNPESGWIQPAFYACTLAVLVKALAVVVLPLLSSRCTLETGDCEDDIQFVFAGETMFEMLMVILKYSCLLAIYGGAVLIVIFVLRIRPLDDDDDGSDLVPPAGPEILCITNLACQFFFVHALKFVCFGVQRCMGTLCVKDRLAGMLVASTRTVMFVPMLSVLFIGVRLRALQITKFADGRSSPTAGVQDNVAQGMYLVTWALLVKLVSTNLDMLLLGPDELDDGITEPKRRRSWGKWCSYFFRCVENVCYFCMYLGTFVVLVGIFTMTPETCPPHGDDGRAGIVPGVRVQQPIAAETTAKSLQ